MDADIVITGRGFGPGFQRLIADKLARLDLRGRIIAQTPDRIALSVQGRPALVDMLAVACLLGPPEALVADVAVSAP